MNAPGFGVSRRDDGWYAWAVADYDDGSRGERSSGPWGAQQTALADGRAMAQGMDRRTCAREGCEHSLAGARPQARFCSGACRAQASRQSRASTGAEPHRALSGVVSGDASAPAKRVNPPGLGVRCYFASTVQADEVYAALIAAGLVDAASRVVRASERQRLKLQTTLDLAA